MGILKPKTLNGYTNMKGIGVSNLQHEYTAKQHFLILFHQNVERANVLFSFPVQAIKSHRKANEADIEKSR